MVWSGGLPAVSLSNPSENAGAQELAPPSLAEPLPVEVDPVEDAVPPVVADVALEVEPAVDPPEVLLAGVEPLESGGAEPEDAQPGRTTKARRR